MKEKEVNKEKEQKKQEKNRRLTTVLIIITTICLIFFILSTTLTCNCGKGGFKKEIVIVQDGVTIDDMKIEALNVHPGESVDYQVWLKSSVSGRYKVTMDFDETYDGGMKEFIDVSITDEKRTENQGLSQLLEGEPIEFVCDVIGGMPYVFDVKYEMPIEVGNEAMNTKTSFTIKFVIVRV